VGKLLAVLFTGVLLLGIQSRAALAGPAAGAQCSRPAVGSAVTPPPDLFSAGGILKVDMDYLTDLDEASRTLFCFRTTEGAQSPTLRVKPGETLDLTVHNKVPALPAGSPTEVISDKSNACGSAVMTETSVNVHFHGTNVSPACGSDQVIRTLVNSGETFHYHLQFPANEPPGLYWYHPHVHGIAEAAVQGGASGLIVVDGIERVQPALAGLPERVLVVRDQTVAGHAMPGGAVPSWDVSLNDVSIASPALTPAVIRMAGHGREFWRLANASADTILDLQLAYDGAVQPLDIVALDGVPTGSQDGNRHGHPVRMDHILLPPAGRAEFVIPPPPPGTKLAVLRTLKIDTGPVGDNDPARDLATVSIDDGSAPDLRVIPSASEQPAPQRFEGMERAAVTAHRKLYFSEVLSDPNDPASPTNFYITVDGATPVLFDPANPPAITTTEGAMEDWTIENRSREVHSFHMHQIHFKVLQQNGVAVPPAERQFRDTVQVPYWSGEGPYPSITVRMDFRGMVVGDYVYHCHILGHEDNGMMAIIRVLPAS